MAHTNWPTFKGAWLPFHTKCGKSSSLEEGFTRHASVEHVEDHSAGNLTIATRYDTRLQTRNPTVNFTVHQALAGHLEVSDAFARKSGCNESMPVFRP